MTATATPTLVDVLRARWDERRDKSNVIGTGDDVVTDLLESVLEAIASDYRVGVTDPHHGEWVNISSPWSEPMEVAARDAGRRAFEEHVLPAMITAIVDRLPNAPEWIRRHPDAVQLRDDLKVLERDGGTDDRPRPASHGAGCRRGARPLRGAVPGR